jgi:putative oxidoreductase
VLVRRVARPLLSSLFVYGGLDAALHPATKVPSAEKVNASGIAQKVGLSDTTQLVRANGVAQVLGGLALSTNRVPRLAALGLVASLVPTTLAGHRFWEEDDETTKKAQRTHFFKNLSVLGGLLLAAVDTQGRESVGHKARRRARRAADVIPIGD